MAQEPQLVPLDSERATVWSGEAMDDSVALSLVMADYDRYSRWRYVNHDVRWNTNDALYVGYMPQRYWEGTRTPRSSLPVLYTFDQIEAALPVIMNALFGDSDWFEVSPILGASIEQAQQVKERLLYLLENPPSKFGHTARSEVRLAAKQFLTYGNGVMNVEPDGQGNPTWSWTDLRDVYLDPDTPTPSVDDSRSLVHPDILTYDDVEAMRGTPGIRLPPSELLRALSQMRLADDGDNTKAQQAALFGMNWRPGQETTQFIPDRHLQILRYTSSDRIIWVLQQRWVMYNQRNPYGFINYAAAPCYVVPGRFYGMGIPDALEGNQKYAQAILNGHLDELSLSLNPPRNQKRSVTFPYGDQSIRPGMRWTSDNPKEDLIFHPPAGVTQNGWQELAWLEQSSAQRTGITGMITSGMPVRSNASRSATGISAQATGPTTRLQYMVEMIEDYLIVPLLYKTLAMDAYLNGTSGSVPGQTLAGQNTTVDANALKATVKFRLKGSTRMLTQSKLQFIAPFLAQYFLNGAFVSQLAKSGQTVDYGEFSRLLQDATGSREAYRLVRPMTPEEKQALQQPSPDAVMRQQQAADSNNVRREIAQLKAQGETAANEATTTQNEEKVALELLKLLSGSMGGNDNGGGEDSGSET